LLAENQAATEPPAVENIPACRSEGIRVIAKKENMLVIATDTDIPAMASEVGIPVMTNEVVATRTGVAIHATTTEIVIRVTVIDTATRATAKEADIIVTRIVVVGRPATMKPTDMVGMTRTESRGIPAQLMSGDLVRRCRHFWIEPLEEPRRNQDRRAEVPVR
jgi:hypothetical protein